MKTEIIVLLIVCIVVLVAILVPFSNRAISQATYVPAEEEIIVVSDGAIAISTHWYISGRRPVLTYVDKLGFQRGEVVRGNVVTRFLAKMYYDYPDAEKYAVCQLDRQGGYDCWIIMRADITAFLENRISQRTFNEYRMLQVFLSKNPKTYTSIADMLHKT